MNSSLRNAAGKPAPASPEPDLANWETAPLPALIRYIVHRHHGYLRKELPRLSERVAELRKLYGDHEDEQVERLAGLLHALRTDLMTHIEKEEASLFPAIERFASTKTASDTERGPYFGSVQLPMVIMEQEHEFADAALAALNEITHGFVVPEFAREAYQAVLDGLTELERDLRQHVRLESDVLFPRARMFEKSRPAAS